MARQYRARMLGICLSGSKTPPPNLCLRASHHLHPHMNTNPYTSSTTPAMNFRWPGNTKRVPSVSVSQGKKCPPPPDLCILAYHHLNADINISPHTTSTFPATHFRWPGDTERVCSVSGSKCPPRPISASRPPTTSTCISTSAHVLPLHTPPHISMARQYRACTLRGCFSG